MKRNIQLKVPSNTQILTKKMSMPLRAAASYINLQEAEGSLAKVRLGQEMLTNWLPKAVFARGLVDLSDKTFLELTENVIVYILPVLVGSLFSKIFIKAIPKNLQNIKNSVAKTAETLIKEKNPNNKTIMPIKAAIATATLAVPLAEYSLSYVKNLFTLKLFKQADFNNIANLNKDKKEDIEKQKRVKESAKKHIKIAAGIYAGCLALATVLATKGKNHEFLQSISEFILSPGSKIFKPKSNTSEAIEKAAQKAKSFNKYFSLDFENKNGKLAMSRGQITACVTVGGFGYFGAAKDRGKQDFKEVLYRFPLVGFYAITGAELVEKAFHKHLEKKGECKELFQAEMQDKKNAELANSPNATKEQIETAEKKMSKLANFGDLAERLAAKKGNTSKDAVEAEFKNLLKQKSKLVMVPFLFSLGFMGFFVAGMSRYFTKYRYDKEQSGKGEMRNVKSEKKLGGLVSKL